MNSETEFKLQLKLSYLQQLWHDFCEQHTFLYELTCDEYMHLLASDTDQLELTIQDKRTLLSEINTLDQSRSELVKEITQLMGKDKPEKLSGLIALLNDSGHTELATELGKRNLVLLDIIEKIQAQNKKNQFFLNKAIYSLKELRESFSGEKKYKTYSAKGMARI